MKILIIGSKGFVGSACYAGLQQHHEVTGADVVDSDEAGYIRLSAQYSFEELFGENRYDVCINASGSANVGYSFTHVEKDYELNVGNVQLMLGAIARSQPACRVINFSSAAVYGNPVSLPINEDAPLNPMSPYGHHKMESEAVLRSAFIHQGVPTCSLRVFSAYGPGLHKQLFWDIYRKRLESFRIRLFGTGAESRDFIYIDDLVSAVKVVIDNAAFKGEAINVSSGSETSISVAARTFLDALPYPSELTFTGESKIGDPINWRADISRLTSLGFTAKFSLKEGLQRTAEEYLSYQS